MIVKLKTGVSKDKIDILVKKLEDELNVEVFPTYGKEYSILGLVGDTSSLDEDQVAAYEYIESVQRIQEPYKRVSRTFKPEDSIIKVGNIEIGGKDLVVMAGPCSVESEEQIMTIARDIKAAGANMLRGGIVKPRTSPYAFQGMGMEGLKLMQKAKEETGLPIVCEIMSISQLEEFGPHIDMIQVGARNMQNFDLLKEIGKTKIPVLLKRGMSATVQEWLMSAEYIMAGGNENVVLCERGIRTFETAYRNVLDLNAVPVIKELTHLPIIVDSAHGTGKWWMVTPLAKAGVAVGADGLMIEVHNDPEHAFSDGPQSLKPEKFKKAIEEIREIAKAVGKNI